MTAFITSLLFMFDCPPSIDTPLVKALILRESKAESSVISSAGAVGLMQVKPVVIIDYNNKHKTNYKEKDLLNPYVNVKIGVWHLCRYKTKTTFRRHLLEIYYVGYSKWKQLNKEPDNKLWLVINIYTRTTRFRYGVIVQVEKLKDL